MAVAVELREKHQQVGHVHVAAAVDVGRTIADHGEFAGPVVEARLGIVVDGHGVGAVLVGIAQPILVHV